MYPLSAGPEKDKFLYFIVSKEQHHFTGQQHCVGDWMDKCLSQEDREFIILDCRFAKEFGKLKQKISDDLEDAVINRILFLKYQFYDTSKDFLNQYRENITILNHELSRIIK